MKDTELIQFVHKTCEMGVVGLCDVKDKISGKAMKGAVESQIKEYKSLTEKTGRILRAAGQIPQGPSGISRAMSGMMSRAKLSIFPTDSKIAEMVIQGNTMGITKCTKHLNDYSGGDPRARELASRLIKTQQANVDQMKPFL